MKSDIERYRRHVDAFDLTEEQKVELLATIWHIVEGFIDRAFGHDSHSLLNASGNKIASHAGKLIDLEGRPLSDAFDVANRGEAN